MINSVEIFFRAEFLKVFNTLSCIAYLQKENMSYVSSQLFIFIICYLLLLYLSSATPTKFGIQLGNAAAMFIVHLPLLMPTANYEFT